MHGTMLIGNKIAAQTDEISEQKSIIPENTERHRSMFNDWDAVVAGMKHLLDSNTHLP